MIRVLDKFIADKIAAGEVIERPVSAVKELIENSIDAGASSIIVEIRGGGKSYIRVTDDGLGIPADETETAFLRHATSKLSSVSDLDNITSLGFRGEALASISAVSRLTMVTRTEDEAAGTRIMLHGGKVVSKEPVGANKGTTIIAEDLFYNTPARRKFMGSDAREGALIIELTEQFAVYYSDIRFMMVRNGETVFTTSGNGNTLDTIRRIYPDNDHSKLIEVSGEGVRGYISDPLTTRSSRKGQLFFVNGRIVRSKIIEKSLEKGYGGRIFSGFPVAILFIDADPSGIDVNIHPGKREIKFLDEDEVSSRITLAVSDACRLTASVPSGLRTSHDEMPALHAGAEVTEQSSIRDYLGSIPRDPEAQQRTSRKEAHCGSAAPEENIEISSLSSYERPAGDHIAIERPDNRPFDFNDLIYKGYIFDTYIIMESSDSVYMFDQHAAHERIYYEKFISAYESSEQLPQPVLTPFTINVSADVYYTCRGMLDPLRRTGYDITDFGPGSFIIRGIPAYVTQEEAVRFAEAYLETAGDAGGGHSAVIDKLIMRSCKSAVKGGERLSEMEIKDLIRDLSNCINPYSCPHGRPTFIRFREYEIERSFRRR